METDFFHRVTDALLGSEFLPVKARTQLMRLLGYDIHPTAALWAGASMRSKKIQIGKYVFINVGFFFDGAAHLEIGNNVRMGQFVRVLTATHLIGPAQQRCVIDAVIKPIRIGDGCWIGCNVVLLPGANIADGCVIGAGSLVTGPTQKNGLYVGSPARLVRILDEEAVRTEG